MPNEIAPESFESALARFIAAAQLNIDNHYAANLPRSKSPLLEASSGAKKYVRVVSRNRDTNGGSAWCFVEVATGDVLKCDGWKRPAKGARGTIYTHDFEKYGVNHYGAKYAK